MSFSASYANLVTTLAGTSGDNAGLDVRGRMPGQTLRIEGATSLATLTTGLNSFTAGTGTSATSVAKQTGSADYTATNLVGKWLKRVSGGGYVAGGDNLRPILSNLTTTIAINEMTGLDNTSVCQIVDLATATDYISASDLIALRVASCLGPVEIVGLDFSATHTLDGLMELRDCVDVRVMGCKLAQNLANPSLSATRVQRLRVEHCRLTASADIEITRCPHVEVTGCVNSAGGVIAIEDCTFVDVLKLSASSAPSRVLSVINSGVVNVEAACSSGGASPLYFKGNERMTAVGGLLTGSGNTGYGAEFESSGHYVITGSTITGTTNAVLFNSTASGYGGGDYLGINYGAMATATMSLVAQTTVTKVAIFNNVLFDGSIDKSAREIAYGVNNPSNATIAAAGTVVGDATQIVQQTFIVVSSCASGAGVKLHNVSVLPGVVVEIYNGAANACIVYPSNGGTINGGASVSIAVGKIGMFRCVDWATDKWIANVAVLG